MKINDALEGIQRLYTETAPLIYYIEENPTYVAKMDVIIKAIEDRPIEAVSWVITLTEVLTHPLKLGNARLVQEYREILLTSRAFHLLPITSRIADLHLLSGGDEPDIPGLSDQWCWRRSSTMTGGRRSASATW